jgi:hypothetical protein
VHPSDAHKYAISSEAMKIIKDMPEHSRPTVHTNRLIHETSLYLLQHAHNLMDWYPFDQR